MGMLIWPGGVWILIYIHGMRCEVDAGMTSRARAAVLVGRCRPGLAGSNRGADGSGREPPETYSCR